MSDLFLLRAAGVGLLLDARGGGMPSVLHWGADPGDLRPDRLHALAEALEPVVAHSSFDAPPSFTLLPGQAEGWSGTPGLSVHQDGAQVFPRLELTGPVQLQHQDDAQVLQLVTQEAAGGLQVATELRLEADGLLRVRHELTALQGGWWVEAVNTLLPVPRRAQEVLDLTGRWTRERSPQRAPLRQGTWSRQSRRGRSGHDAPLLLVAGTQGFGWRHGEVWAAHLAWSGNGQHLLDHLPEGAGAGGASALGAGELLLPGEVRLEPGQSYRTPWTCFTYSDQGLDGASARVHRWLRSRPEHPGRPRPLVLNTWEAVYFDHRLEPLLALADRAAEIGVERFVLDDGWFRHRRDDSAGLGDWFVDEGVWPQGLRPLADAVRERGMEFGLWFEPEMVNPDSDLARAHPDWLLRAPGRDPLMWRRQLVLDLAHPAAFAFLAERITTLVRELDIAFIKWDHNRDLHEAVHVDDAGRPRAGVHAQTLALYALLDRLQAECPGLEIESCASGGGRVDLGILAHTQRVWASDSNDALERQLIQRWTGLLLTPELVGAHIGPATAHTSGRTLDLGLRMQTALFGHAGLEWDITTCTEQEVDQLKAWAQLYKQQRGLLHSGDVVRLDGPDGRAVGDDPGPASFVHGVVARDQASGLFCYVRVASDADVRPGRLLLPGLDPARSYRVQPCPQAGTGRGVATRQPPWWLAGGVVATGAVLADVGLPAPSLAPAQAVTVQVQAVEDPPADGG